MKDIIQMSSSDRWSNNLQKRAPYTLRSALFYLSVFTTQVPSGAHILYLKLPINPNLPQKCLPRVCLFEKLPVSPLCGMPLQYRTPRRHLINDFPLGYILDAAEDAEDTC